MEVNAWLGLLFARLAPSSNSSTSSADLGRLSDIFGRRLQVKHIVIFSLRRSLLPSRVDRSIDPKTNDYVPGGKSLAAPGSDDSRSYPATSTRYAQLDNAESML